MTTDSASRSSARRTSGSDAAPPTAGSASVFALGRTRSRFADTFALPRFFVPRAMRARFKSDAPPSPHGFPLHWLSFGEAALSAR